MRYLSLACDYDGTLATDGVVSPSTLAALLRLRDSGRKLLMVTGRVLDDLQLVFPEFAIFERIVAENGALLYSPQTNDAKLLGDPPPPEFVQALRKRGADPLIVGRSIVATVEPYDVAVHEIIRDLGLELQVIYNKGSVMVLPSGVNKGTGLLAAVSDLGLSEHNTVGVGDAENDHALLNMSECAVAVSNAIPTLKDRADVVMSEPEGKGVEELIDRLLLNDLRDVPTRPSRSKIVLGTARDGEEVSIPSYGAGVLIAGPSESGKSTVVRALLERLLEADYQVCLIDPEGDYDHLESIISLGSPERPPDLNEIFQVLEKPKSSLSINLLGLAIVDRPPFFSELCPPLQELRSRTGRPHWIIVDEAHHVLPSSRDASFAAFTDPLSGLILITVQPQEVLPAILKNVTAMIAVGDSPQITLRSFADAVGSPSPIDFAPASAQPGEVLFWTVGPHEKPVPVRVLPSSGESRRHKRKYAEGRLPPDRSFHFTGPEGKLNLRAYNLIVFSELAKGVDDETWLYHLREGAYSNWFRGFIKDAELASEVVEIERNWEAPANESRDRILEAINRRYTAPA